MRPLLTTNLTYMTDSTAADDKKLKLIKVGMVVAHVIKTLFSLTNWFTFFFFLLSVVLLLVLTGP